MPSRADHHRDRRGEPRRHDGPRPRNWARLARAAPMTAALAGLALIAAGCGRSSSPGAAGGGSRAGGSSSGVLAEFNAYARCMRSHGISDFPDPTTSPGGGVGIQLNGGPGSDLNKHNPRFEAAYQACRSLEPGATSGTPQQTSQKIAAEVKWARCMRSHGLLSFPDPNSQGAFDRRKFDESAPAFQSASTACQSPMSAVGPIPVHP